MLQEQFGNTGVLYDNTLKTLILHSSQQTKKPKPCCYVSPEIKIIVHNLERVRFRQMNHFGNP